MPGRSARHAEQQALLGALVDAGCSCRAPSGAVSAGARVRARHALALADLVTRAAAPEARASRSSFRR